MKLFGLIISAIYASIALGQTQTSKVDSKNLASAFSLSLTTFSHAELLFNGITTYRLTNTSMKVINTPFGEKKGKVIFFKPLLASQNSYVTINNFGLNSLKDFYFNNCIMVISGVEYYLDFKNSSMTKHINLHHYYLKQLEDIINLINSYMPQKYQFHYIKKDTKQDCSL